MTSDLRFRRRGRALTIALATVILLSIALMPSVSAQSGGFGVGSGHGLEVGINLPVLDQVRADIAAGLYDRACTAAEHDPTKWHTLVNVEAKCHYDHHHGDDPHYVSDIFGEPGGWFQNPGQSISYPWQTFPAKTATESNAAYLGTGVMENEAKHEGYYWVVRRDQPCNSSDGQFCVKDFRVQFHGITHAHGASVRWHSMSAELRACRNVNDVSTCGIVRTGGWMDHGRLYVIDAAAVGNRALCAFAAPDNLFLHVPLPVDSQYFPLPTQSLVDESRCHPQLTPQMIEAGPSTGNVGDGPKAEWWVHGASDFRFQVQIANPIGNIYETSPGSGQLQNHIFCDFNAPDCNWNQSILTMRIQYFLGINTYYLGPYHDGRTTSLGLDDGRYITRFGGINDSCTAPGLDCIPIEYNNLQLSVDPGRGLAGFSHTPCEECQKVDYDLSPQGQQWLTWFYHKYGHHTPPPPSEPDPQPEEPTGPAVYFEVDNSSADSAAVNVRLIGVQNLYGIQTECQVNPQVLQGTTLTLGDTFNDSNSFVVDEGFQESGIWRVAATRLKPNPAINGDATAFTLNYNVIAAGDGQLQCSVLPVDENGHAIDLEVVNGTVIILPPSEPAEPGPIHTEEPPVVQVGTITGLAAYQNRPNNAGITVRLVGINDAVLDEVVTNEDGTFAFPELPVGEYTLLLLAPQHIPVVETVVIETADSTVQLADQLRAGDVDDNGRIDLEDVMLISANFGIEVVPGIEHFDLNQDGWINISDLTLAGGNYDLTSPLLEMLTR